MKRAPFVKDISIDPLSYGYTLDECKFMMPITLGQLHIPDDFPSPWTLCQVCTRKCVSLAGTVNAKPDHNARTNNQ